MKVVPKEIYQEEDEEGAVTEKEIKELEIFVS